VKSQKAHKFLLAILTFSRVIGPGASAKAVLWKTSGQKGGSGGAGIRKSRFCRMTYVQIQAWFTSPRYRRGNGAAKGLSPRGAWGL
jgi:hypothetical protein